MADPAFNAEAHVRSLARVHEAGAQYALCPELGMSAYSCGDLFLQEPLLRGVLDALAHLARATAAWDLVVPVGDARMAHRRHVHPDLVRPPGFQLDL